MNQVLASCMVDLRAGIDGFPWESKVAYADWLAQTYYYVRHTTRLLAASAARFPFGDVGNALHHRFAAHMNEEKKHELLAIHDLQQIGESIGKLPERSPTRAFYEAQYFKIEHIFPTALFGYILPLESLGPACGARIIERVTQAHGSKCISFLRLHSSEDVAHLEKALAMIAGVSREEQVAIEDNMRQTTWCYCALLSDIAAAAGA